ncbi:unnamed protein product [Musa acuminata var. zebrina]
MKVVGTLVCVSGTILMILYWGRAIIGSTIYNISDESAVGLKLQAESVGWLTSGLLRFGLEKWHIGVLCLIGNCFCLTAYFVPMLIKYPSCLSLTTYLYFFGDGIDWNIYHWLSYRVDFDTIRNNCYLICRNGLRDNDMVQYNLLQPAMSFLGSTIYLGRFHS